MELLRPDDQTSGVRPVPEEDEDDRVDSADDSYSDGSVDSALAVAEEVQLGNLDSTLGKPSWKYPKEALVAPAKVADTDSCLKVPMSEDAYKRRLSLMGHSVYDKKGRPLIARQNGVVDYTEMFDAYGRKFSFARDGTLTVEDKATADRSAIERQEEWRQTEDRTLQRVGQEYRTTAAIVWAPGDWSRFRYKGSVPNVGQPSRPLGAG